MHIAKPADMATKKGRNRHSHAPHTVAKIASVSASSTQASTPSITVSEEPFGVGFDVQLSRPADGNARGREFYGYPNALAYARVLRLEFGLPIIDRCGEQS